MGSLFGTDIRRPVAVHFLLFVAAGFMLSAAAFAQQDGGKSGIELPTVTITGQARYLEMPQQPVVVRKELRLAEIEANLLPEVHKLRAYPPVSLQPTFLAPTSGGCLFGNAIGASTSMLFAKQKSLFRYALTLYEKGRFTESDERLKRLLDSYPRSEFAPQALFFRGQIALGQKRYEPAHDLFKKLVDEHPESALRHNALCNLAYSSYSIDETQNCISALTELLTKFTDSPKAIDARRARAAIQFKEENYIQAADDFAALADLATDADRKNEYILWQIESLFFGDQPDEALELCRKNELAFGNSEKRPRFLYVMASALLALGREEAALGLFDDLARNYPESEVAAAAQFAAAEIRRDNADWVAAEAGFKKIVWQYRDSAYYCPAQLNLAAVRLALRDFASARDALIQSEQTCGSDREFSSRISYNMGLLLAFEGRPEDALGQFEDAQEMAEDKSVKAAAYLGQGWCNFVGGRYSEAAKSLDESLVLKPPAAIRLEALFWSGQARLKLGDAGKALQSFQALLGDPASGPSNKLDSHLGLGFAYLKQGQWKAAIDSLSVVAESDREGPDRAVCSLQMAHCDYQLDQFKSAIAHAERAEELTDLSPVLCGAEFVKGKSLLRLEKKKEGLKVLASIPERFPDCEHVDDAQFAVASTQFEDNEFKASIKSYKGLLSKSPESIFATKAILGIANSYYNLGNYPEATEFYSKTLESNADRTDKKSALYGLILCYQRQGLLMELETKIEDFIERFKDQQMAGTLRSLLAEELANRQQYFAAIRQYNKAFYSLEKVGVEEVELAKILYRIGQIMEQTGDKKGAISEYDQIVFRFKNNRFVRTARLRQAHLYAELREIDKATAIYTALAKDYPDDEDTAGVALLRHAELIKRDARTNALKLCDEVVSRFKNRPIAANALILSAELSIDNEDFGAARAKLDQAEKIGIPADKKDQAAYLLGHSYFMEGDFKEASTTLMRVRYLYPASPWAPEALLQAGKSLMKIDQPGEAKKVFMAILRDYPDEKGICAQAQSAIDTISD
ncbi:MAG: tetratricopeptide repeat protein [Candidatus Coatesbacteria bacterium]|nr:tetratricopeptide repeat protein [Candidatus Coatesbacteria bacterium]